MKRLFTTTFLLVILAVGCKSEEKNKKADIVSDIENISVLDTLELKFDDGKKWIVNAETHEGIEHMDSIISAFKEERSKDYKMLGDHLAKQTSYVIKNCSMKGEPHDQLHVVLVPMLDEISILREQTISTESIAAIDRLEQLIGLYFQHFKI